MTLNTLLFMSCEIRIFKSLYVRLSQVFCNCYFEFWRAIAREKLIVR